MAKEGYPFLVMSLGIAGIVGLAGVFLSSELLLSFSIVLTLFGMFVLFFFRDPERAIKFEDTDILSPGDGVVVSINEVNEDEFFKTKVQRISIFLSVFNVHVNRVPINGKVEYFRYQKGSFRAAFKEEASAVNEQTIIGIVNNNKKVLFKQIAGLIARRIVCTLEEGLQTKAGDRCGLIRFGSRVDVFLPSNAETTVVKGQKVTGGITVIGRFNDEE